MSSTIYFDFSSPLDESKISKFIDAGLCYIKLPTNIQEALLQIRDQALVFFHLPSDNKALYKMHDGDGYLDQSIDTSANIQRYIYRNRILAPDIQTIQNQLVFVRTYLRDQIFFPLLDQVTSFLNMSKCYSDFTDSPDQTLSLIYYPKSKESAQRIKGHKDISAMTALWAPEPGLFSMIDNNWVGSISDDSYIAVQIGLALELATDQQCHGIEHSVELGADTERFSLASFFSPNMNSPLINYKTKNVIAEKFGELVQQHLQETYED